MAVVAESRISLTELRRRLVAADPTAMLVEPRIVRRVIKQDRRLAGLGLNVPHRKSYTIPADRLLVIVDRAELNLPPAADLPEMVILLAEPDEDDAQTNSAEQLLFNYSRMLFHSRVHMALQAPAGSAGPSPQLVTDRVREIGRTEFAEFHDVLLREDLLLPPRDDWETYVEFAAVYLELRYFAPEDLPWYFPTLRDYTRIDALLARDVDHVELYVNSRLEGAPERLLWREPSERRELRTEEGGARRDPLQPSPPSFWKLLAQAERAGSLGNRVKAAILRTRAARLAVPIRAAETRAAARVEIERLLERLSGVLQLQADEVGEWVDALDSLLPLAARGFWVTEARLLYDLQKVCIEHERGVYALDLLEWAWSLGKVPWRRPLPLLREVLLAKHLRSAARRLPLTRMQGAKREHLALLLATAERRMEAVMRDLVRPRLVGVLDEVGLCPSNVPERVARRKLVEELLDRIVDRGFSTIGDLRDALSQNNLKLADLSGIREFVFGDRLLRADQRLSRVLDGVYRRGAIYQRLPQRLSSLAFGTPIGRFLTRYVAMPYGGAYLAVEAVKHVVNLFSSAEAPPAPADKLAAAAAQPSRAEQAGELLDELPAAGSPLDPAGLWQQADAAQAPESTFGGSFLDSLAEEVPAAPAHAATYTDPWLPVWVLLLGTLILLLIHKPNFRQACLRALRAFLRGTRRILIELPADLLQSPFIQRVLDSHWYRLLRSYAIKPALFSAMILVPSLVWGGRPGWAAILNVFLAVNLFLNSPLGRYFDEWLTDVIVRGWRELQVRVLATAFQVVMELFSQLLEGLERLLYSVDEWLRFRSGDRRLFLVLKAVLGVFWAFLAYFVQIYVTLLIEPQINPIKHFPVVTVSHKIMLPWVPMLTRLLAAPLEPFVGKFVANTFAAVTVLLLPGVFGYLVWELKENWRLYAANRSRRLSATIVGHHGETVVRMLRPGFHSGRLPKVFARLRRCSRKARLAGNPNILQRPLSMLHHYEEDVRHFVERELLALLEESSAWGDIPVELQSVRLATNRLEVELRPVGGSSGRGRFLIEERSGWLLASFQSEGWLDLADPHQSRVFAAAVAGLYKFAGVDLVREQLLAAVAPQGVELDFQPEGIRVYTAESPGRSAFYRLKSQQDWYAPQVREPTPLRWPTLERREILFASVPLTWEAWVRYWEDERQGFREGSAWLHPENLVPAPAAPTPPGVSVEA